MYRPAAFDETDAEAIAALIAAHPLATLVTVGEAGLTAEHVPMLLDRSRGPHGTLVGHVARANPVWRAARAALAVFTGPDGYVSPNWYPSKHDDPRVVPTWNYAVVHAHGALRTVDDPGLVLGIVGALTRRHEAGRPEPWHVDDAPAEYVHKMLRAIVGIELEIERVEAKSKLSQNRTDADRRGVVTGLAADGADALADRMRAVGPNLP